MKIPLNILCDSCKKDELLFIDLSDTSFERNCSCGERYSGFLSNDFNVGHKLLIRSRYELMERKDFSLSIVMSAAAFECELSRLHFRWNDISALKKGVQVTNEELEQLLRKYGSIYTKIEGVSKLMDPRGFQAFVAASPELSKMIANGFPNLRLSNLTTDFQQKLFWPRNRVLHLADSSFNHEDGARCFNIATLGIKILEDMDKVKRSVG